MNHRFTVPAIACRQQAQSARAGMGSGVLTLALSLMGQCSGRVNSVKAHLPSIACAVSSVTHRPGISIGLPSLLDGSASALTIRMGWV